MKYLKETQILTSNYPYYKYSLDYALDSLERMQNDRIEFYGCYPHFHLDDVDYQDVRNVKRKLRAHNLRVACFTPEQCLYPVNIAAKDLAARKRSMDVFRKSICCAAEFGAEFVVVLAGYGTLDEDEKNVWPRSVESLSILGELAESSGVKLVLETSPREYTTTHNSRDVLHMIRETGSPAVSGMIDMATLGFSGESMREAIQDLEGNLSYVHVADGVPGGHLILGSGELDIQEMLKELDDAGYEGPLSLEILNDRYIKNPQDAMEKSLKILRKYIKEM